MHEVPEAPEQQGHPHLEDAVLQAVDADDGQGGNRRQEHGAGQPEHGDERRDGKHIQQHQEHVADVHAGDDPPDERCVLLKEQRPRPQTEDQQSAEHDGRGGRPRNAEGEQRDHRPDRRRIVGALRSRHPLNGAGAEPLGMP